MRSGQRICPHCGAADPASGIVTLCRKCGKPLADTVLPSPVPLGARPSPTVPSVPSAPPPPMPIPKPPWEGPGLPDDLGVAEEAEAGSETPQPPSFGLGSPHADWPLRLPIALHLTLYILGTMAGFMGLPMLLMSRGLPLLPQWLPMPIAFLGSGIVGLTLAKLAFRFLILGRCPKCGGAARVRDGRPMTYTCLVCGHVHRTSVSGG